MTNTQNMTIREFVQEYPFFTEALLLNITYKNRQDLLEFKAIEKIGKRILIHKETFLLWLATRGITENNARVKIRSSVLERDETLDDVDLFEAVQGLDSVLTQKVDRPKYKRPRKPVETTEDILKAQNIVEATRIMNEAEVETTPEEEPTPEVKVEEVGKYHPLRGLFEKISKEIIGDLEEKDEDPEVVVIESDSKGQFEHQIEEALSNGWRFAGDMRVTTKGLFRTKRVYTQLMAK